MTHVLPLRCFLIGTLFVLMLGYSHHFARGQSAGMDNCSGGLLYYLSFPDTTTNTWDSRYPAQLIRTRAQAFSCYIYSPVDQLLSIGRAGGAGNNIPISAGQILEYNTEAIGVPLVTVINRPQTNVVRIRAQYPVIIYGYMLTPFGIGAYTALPVESWGTEYYVAAWPGQIARDVFPNGETNYRAVPKEAPAEILIVAAYDSTRVTIVPTTDLAECPDCRTNPPTITLKAGEAYLVQSTVDTGLAGLAGQGDLGGTLVQSSKPIGVISGNTRLMHNAGTMTALGENAFKNMAIQWLPPVEQHGTEFVFTPAWDDRSFQPGRDVAELREAEYVRLFATQSESGTDAVRLMEGADSILTPSGSLDRGELVQDRIGLLRSVNEARGYRTSGPAFGVMSPESVVKFNGTTTTVGGVVGSSYLAWSTYMVELVPREQWTSFAPTRAPSLPTSMVHYLNLVTDTLNQFNVYVREGSSPRQLFPFDRGRIPGTDLVWGWIQIGKGVDYFIEGDKGARFTGHAYGSYRGQEQYRPGRTREDDDGKGSSINDDGRLAGAESLHPSEYEEDVALMYAFPLAPSRCLLESPDQYAIETAQDCGAMTIRISAVNPDPVGLRSITLLPDSSTNARLQFITPADPLALIANGIAESTVLVVPVDPKKDASGVVAIRDRTRGGIWRVEYRYEAEQLEVDSTRGIDFGLVQTNAASPQRSITIANPLTGDVIVKRLGFVLGNQEFRIARVEPSFDWETGLDSITLRSGDSLQVWIDITPQQNMRTYDDSLWVEFGCSRMSLLVRGRSALPCLTVGDLDFGTVQRGRSRELTLQLCNTGGFPVTFHDSTATGGGDIISWLEERFIVAGATVSLLRNRTLDSGECVSVRVGFRTADTGVYRTTARFWINGRQCRDTSVWTAHVTDTTSGVAGEDVLSGSAVTAVTPNPTSGETRIEFRLASGGETSVDVYDACGRLVAKLRDERLSAGDHEALWDARGVAAGLYYVRVRSGVWSGGMGIILVR